mgnify:CR=1 FL=1
MKQSYLRLVLMSAMRKTVLRQDTLSAEYTPCLLYTSDAADERSSVDLGGRRIIKKKKKIKTQARRRQ